MTLSSSNIAIAGAGLLGRLLAWRLGKLGHRVTLIEAGSFSNSKSAAYTAAAMISPMSEVVVSQRAIYEMGIHSLKLWQHWLCELPNNFSTLYKANGSIVVAHSQDANELEQFYSDLQFHLGDKNNSHWLNRRALHDLEPDLSESFERGLFLPNEAFLDNRAFLDNLLDLLIEENVTLVEHCSVTFDDTINIECNNHVINPEDFDMWFDCRGMGAKKDNNVRGVRGEVIWVETPEVNLTHPLRLMHPRYKLYVVPKSNNRYILGATEIESDDASPMSVQSALELCSALYSINPAFAEARILEIDTNLRPSLIDNMPCVAVSDINVNNKCVRLAKINGLYRHGYLLAPTLVEYVLHTTGVDKNTDSDYFHTILNRQTLL